MLCQTLFHTLKLAPHERPSSQPLTKNPQQLCYFLCQTLTKDPQQVWQTLKNFDYPESLQHKNRVQGIPLHPVVLLCFDMCFFLSLVSSNVLDILSMKHLWHCIIGIRGNRRKITFDTIGITYTYLYMRLFQKLSSWIYRLSFCKHTSDRIKLCTIR